MTVVESVGWVLVHFLWQGAVIAALLRLVLALAAPVRSTVRYALGCGALALMVAAPAITAARLARADAAPLDIASTQMSSPSAGMTSSATAARTDRNNRTTRELEPTTTTAPLRPIVPLRQSQPDRQNHSARWSLPPSIRARVTAMLPWLVGAWAIGVMLLSVRLAGGWWRTRALRTRGIEAAPDACQRLAARLMARMRITKPVAFFVSSRVTAPIVFGHVKPVILVPAAVLAGLSPSQLDAILAHELAHVRRHDYLVNLMQTVIETVFFYHPAVWHVSRLVRQAREECCDDIAVAACGDRRDYVEALFSLEQMRHAAATVALGATDGSLLARARRLLIDTEREGASPRLTASAIATAVAGMAMAGISMAATAPVIVERALPTAAASAASASSTSSTSSGSSTASPSPAESSARVSSSSESGESSKSDESDEAAALEQASQSPQPVTAAPNPSASFSTRRAWAEREANTRRASRYWLGYAIRPVKGLHPMVYFDREMTVTAKGGARFSGHFFSDRAEGLRFPGRPLAVAGADPSAIKILFLLDAREGTPRLTRVHASTLPLPFDADDRPIFWIGGADTASSLAAIDGFYAGAAAELKEDLVSTAGLHEDSPAVVAWLEARLQGSDPDEVRGEAAEAIAWHPIPAALSALERAARQDRASRVRQESAEALGDLEMPEAAPVLIALAKSLDDREARLEAIEALGERPEASARDALGALAREDANVDIQKEAVETLGDYKDGRGEAILQDILRTHPREEVRREAIETLIDRAKPAEALALLRDVVQRDADLHVRGEALEALAELPDGSGLDALVEIAREHPDRDTRKKAIEALTESEHPKARQILERILQKPSGE